jgi:hypothetical protein
MPIPKLQNVNAAAFYAQLIKLDSAFRLILYARTYNIRFWKTNTAGYGKQTSVGCVHWSPCTAKARWHVDG